MVGAIMGFSIGVVVLGIIASILETLERSDPTPESPIRMDEGEKYLVSLKTTPWGSDGEESYEGEALVRPEYSEDEVVFRVRSPTTGGEVTRVAMTKGPGDKVTVDYSSPYLALKGRDERSWKIFYHEYPEEFKKLPPFAREYVQKRGLLEHGSYTEYMKGEIRWN